MLGEAIYEARAKVIGQRVLPSGGQGPKVETSFRGGGNLVGTQVGEFGTYVATARPDGTLWGEGQGLIMGPDGETVTWVGQGVGRFTGGGGVSFRGAVYFQSASPKFTRLNGVAGVFEYEQDGDGNGQSKIWEWK